MVGHLVHIGYPKTGSNFLRRWFQRHPQLAYAEGGIAGFQSVYELAKPGGAQRPGVLYRVTSSESMATPHEHVGDPIGTYEMKGWGGLPGQTAVCTTLAELFPAARVLIVTRGFRSMILSSYS